MISIWMHTAHDLLNPDMTEGISLSDVIVNVVLSFVFFFLRIESTQRGVRPHSSPSGALCWRCGCFLTDPASTQSGGESVSRGRPFHPVWPLSRCHNGKTMSHPLKCHFSFHPTTFPLFVATEVLSVPLPPTATGPSLTKSIIVFHRFSFRLIALPFKCQVGISPISSQVKPPLYGPLVWRSCSVSV